MAPIGVKLAVGQISPQTEIPWKFAIAAAVITLLLATYNKAYDFIVRLRRTSGQILKEEGALSLVVNNAVDRLGNGDIMNLGAEDTRKVVQDILQAIRFQTRIIIGNFDERYLEVTLLKFQDKTCNSMLIFDRALRLRSIDKLVTANETMAYYAARSGTSRVVYDFRKGHPFKKEGLSDKQVQYRSIMFVPLIKRLSDSRYQCFGVITIDSERAYEFWGSIQDRLVVRIQPYLNLLRWVLADAPFLEVGESHVAHH